MELLVDELQFPVLHDEKVVGVAFLARDLRLHGADDGDALSFGSGKERRHEGAVQRFAVKARPVLVARLSRDDAFGEDEEVRPLPFGALDEVAGDRLIFFARFLHEELAERHAEILFFNHFAKSSGKSFLAVLRCSVKCCS